MRRQTLNIILAASLFIVLDLSVYFGITRHYIHNDSPEMQAKSVNISDYLPFAEETGIVRTDASLKLTEDLPVLDGAAALFPVFSAFVHAVYPEDSVIYDGENFTDESALHYTNTRGAYTALAEGDADIIFCAAPSDAQMAYLKEMGKDPVLVPIGREAFVFIVNAQNTVDDLSVNEVRKIYAGEITNWKEVGGNNRRIDALQRNEGSGSQTTMEKFMGDTPMKRNILGFGGSAIGFSFRYYVENIVANGGVKILSLNGVYPDKEHIRDGSYPLVSEFYAIYDKNDPCPNIPVLIAWITSPEGQKIIEDTGYIPLK